MLPLMTTPFANATGLHLFRVVGHLQGGRVRYLAFMVAADGLAAKTASVPPAMDGWAAMTGENPNPAKARSATELPDLSLWHPETVLAAPHLERIEFWRVP